MILAGLWFGEKKPVMSLYTRPLMDSLKKLETDGINIDVSGAVHVCKAFLLCGIADLPAKSLVMNCNQYKGEFRCMNCLQSGETFRTQKGGSVRVFPYDITATSITADRTREQCCLDAINAVEQKKTINGIKGPSFLMAFRSFDFVRCSAIAYMHGELLGITKTLISLWISPSMSKEKFSVSHAVDLLDERLTKIKPPAFITRIPRTISSHFKYWKASELRSWLFYYSLPILKDVLSSDYFLHYACFVQAVYLLCTDCISEKDLEESQKLLSYFVYTFPKLYGQRYMTLNIHSLLHLPKCVKDLGPLWVYSCFLFEDANGTLLQLFHGTQNIELQILSSLNILQNFSKMAASIDDKDLKTFVNKLSKDKLSKTIVSGASTGGCPLGRGWSIDLCDDLYVKVIHEINQKPSRLVKYKRITLRGEVLHSAEYSRVFLRNTFSVKYFDVKSNRLCFGSILYYIHAKFCFCSQDICSCNSVILAVLQEYEKKQHSIVDADNFLKVYVPHVTHCLPKNSTIVVDISKIMSVLVNINFGDHQTYLCDVPNKRECD